MAMLKVDGDKQIAFEYYQGATDAPVIVLSHGWGMAGAVWGNTIAKLTDAGLGVVSYDHRCCGASDKDFEDVSIAALGADLVAIVDTLALQSVVLNGWSLGGAVVVDAAAKLSSSLSPARLAGVVLTAGASPKYTQGDGFAYGGQPSDVEATVGALRADRVNFLKGLYFDGVFVGPVTEDTKQWCWQIALQASPGADASLGALADVDQRELLQSLTVPLLSVVGAQDGVVVPEIGRYAAENTPQGSLLELQDCGHAPFLEHPDQYHHALLKFCQGLS